ncbi:MAG: sugar kinase [Chloroflexota bacterium]|nr:sugar kinase [Chloroflexota bacterium]
MPRYDVVTFGETMMRLTPPGYLRIEQTTSFDIWVGGTESNTAIGLARLGMNAAWFSRLPASPMGRYVSNRVQQYGVDVSHIVWVEDARLGIFFHEKSEAPRASRIIYDRKDSAVSRVQPADLPADLFLADMSRLFHVTGITLAISDSARTTALAAMRRAKAIGWLASFDTNYRSTLWSGERAAADCDEAMAMADIVFCPFGDYQALYGDASPDEALAALAAKYPETLIVMTLGKDGARAIAPDGEVFRQSAILAGEVGRIGGGDAFAAGFLYAWLSFADLALALKWGVAMSAHKYTIPGDLPLVDYEEVASLVAGSTGGGLIR